MSIFDSREDRNRGRSRQFNPAWSSPSGGGFNPALESFILGLDGLGAGTINTAPQVGTGSPTFTRATVAWTKLANGLWAQVASGTARSSYIGLTTAVSTYGGYLAEDAGTQLVTPTASIRDMTDASWVKVTMNAAKTATGIDGVTNSASTITATGASSTILKTLVAAASSRTYGPWIRRKTGTGTIELMQGATALDITAQINSATYTRVQLPASVLDSAFGIRITTSGDALDVDFNQFEAGAFATSPMDAAGAARNVDELSYPFAGNGDATQGTAYAELTTEWTAAPSSAMAVSFSGVLGGGIINGRATIASTVTGIRDGTNLVEKNGLTALNTGIRKRASSWGTTGLSVAGDGAAPATGAFDGDIGSVSVQIGGISGSSWYGTIKNIRIWKTQLPDATLQTLTA